MMNFTKGSQQFSREGRAERERREKDEKEEYDRWALQIASWLNK
jgi:hypothetical protein